MSTKKIKLQFIACNLPSFFLTEKTLCVLAKNSLFTIPGDFLFRQFVVGILFCIFVCRYFRQENLLELKMYYNLCELYQGPNKSSLII